MLTYFAVFVGTENWQDCRSSQFSESFTYTFSKNKTKKYSSHSHDIGCLIRKKRTQNQNYRIHASKLKTAHQRHPPSSQAHS